VKDIIKALRNGEVVIGVGCQIPAPCVVEMMGYAGWDYVNINCENAPIAPYGTELENMIRAAYAGDIYPMVKLLSNSPAMIWQALDLGAKAVMVSIRNKEELLRAIAATKYAPHGNRNGAPSIRAAKYGFVPWPEYMEQAYTEAPVIPLLETREAMDNMDDILSVDGLALVTIGPFDLALDLGGLEKPGVASPRGEALL